MRGRGGMEEPGRKFHGKEEGNTRQSWENGGRVWERIFPPFPFASFRKNLPPPTVRSTTVRSSTVWSHTVRSPTVWSCLTKRMIQGEKCINTKIPYPSRVKLFLSQDTVVSSSNIHGEMHGMVFIMDRRTSQIVSRKITNNQEEFFLLSPSASHSYQEKRKQGGRVKKTSGRETVTTITMQNFRTQEEKEE